MRLKYLLVVPALLLVTGGILTVHPEGDARQAAPAYPLKDFKDQVVYQVARVVDGDTVALKINDKEINVRLIGVDTSKTVDSKEPVQSYGKEASVFTNNLLQGEEVYIEYDGEKPETDKHEVLLAYLYRAPDGLFVNLEIIRQGYGRADTVSPFKYNDLFKAYEKRAKESQKGLWSLVVKEKSKSVDENADIRVYITTTGRKYHRKNCKDLYTARFEVSLKEVKRRNYDPCKVCNPPEYK